MNYPWVQQMSAAPPWWRAALFAALSDGVQIGGRATVGSMPRRLLQISVLLQIMKRPLHRGAGQLHVRGNGVDTRPALSLGIGAIPQVHINRLGSGGQFGVGINGSEVTHISSSPNAFVRLDFLLTAVWVQVASCPMNLLDWGRFCARSTRLAYATSRLARSDTVYGAPNVMPQSRKSRRRVCMGWVPVFMRMKLPLGMDFSSSGVSRARSIIWRD